MNQKNKLEDLNKEALENLETYMKEKGTSGSEEHAKIHSAKEEWQLSWSKLMETLLVLEKLEI
jgi:hypothetical protein